MLTCFVLALELLACLYSPRCVGELSPSLVTRPASLRSEPRLCIPIELPTLEQVRTYAVHAHNGKQTHQNILF